MGTKGLRISPKHGLNPTIPKCFICGQDKNELYLFGYTVKVERSGRMVKDAKAPQNRVFDREPCDQCKNLMEDGGIFLIAVRDGETSQNPYRAGHLVVVKESWVHHVIADPEIKENVLRIRAAFIPMKTWTALGLPT